jgi:hypothetical protein
MSDAGHGYYVGRGYGGHGCGCSRMHGRGRCPPAYIGGSPQGRGYCHGDFPPAMGNVGRPMGVPPGPPGGYPGGPAGGPPQYHAPLAMNGGYDPTSGLGIPPDPTGVPLGAEANVQQQLYFNVVKRYANWNACYSCEFDVAEGHMSMSCQPHLRIAMHHIG